MLCIFFLTAFASQLLPWHLYLQFIIKIHFLTQKHILLSLKQHNISENAIFCYDTIRRIPSANQIEECSFEMLIIRLLFNNFILFHWYDFYVYSNSSYLFIEVLNFMFISMRSNDVFFIWIWLIHLMSHLQMKV